MSLLSVLILFVAIFIFIGIGAAIEEKKKSKAMQLVHQKDQTSLQNTGFTINNMAVYKDIALYVDAHYRHFAIKNNGQSDILVYGFDYLNDFEFIDNGDGGTKGSLGRAVAGGILFGGVGMLAGMSSNTTGKCNCMQIRLFMNDISHPEFICKFVDKELTKTDSEYNEALQNAKTFYSLLVYIANNRQYRASV